MTERQEPMQGNTPAQDKMPMQGDMPIVVYWHDNQLILTYHSKLGISNDKTSIIKSLGLENLNASLGHGYYLQSFSKKDVLRRHSSIDADDGDELEEEDKDDLLNQAAQENNDLNSSVGKYLFGLPADEGTLVISFFHIRTIIPDIGKVDHTQNVIDLINNNIRATLSTEDSHFLEALPNWLNGGTNIGPNIITHGCPVTPPIPAGDSCDSGRWTITLPPQLPDSLQEATGDGVTMFVLDTLPRRSQVKAAAQAAGMNNQLLQDIYENVKFNYHVLSDDLDIPNPDQPATGKDIYGRLVGFPMNDHGIFVAGIIRDLAPDAKVECIRVLNDYGIGNTAMLIQALENIHNRMLPVNPNTKKAGDLYNAPVVINLSLVATPADEELADFGYTVDSIKPARLGILRPIEILAAQGAVFVAAAGNDSDPRETMMNKGKRWQARYPAAFAYPGVSKTGVSAVIPVGAVNQSGEASSYSNYPGPLGIATYGGEIPQPNPSVANTNVVTQVEEPIDALRGVYSATLYPALSKSDLLPYHSPAPVVYPEYQPSPTSTWAYWAGTSFATPIISALAARILENQPSHDDSVRQTLISAAPQQVEWTRLDSGDGNAEGPMIMVSQECSIEGDFVEVDIAITEVDIRIKND